MDSQRTRAPEFTPNFELLEDIARTLKVSSESLRERLCPDHAYIIPVLWSQLHSADFAPTVIAEVRRNIINLNLSNLAQDEVILDFALSETTNNRKH